MNWKRGFLRLWAIIAVVWIAGALEARKPWRDVGYLLAEAPTVAVQQVPEDETEASELARLRLEAQHLRAEARRQAAPDNLTQSAAFVFAPPFGLLIVGWLVVWVGRGFRQER